MVTKEAAHRLAAEWIDAWNSHDIDRILSHYEADVELVSPVAARLLGAADGKVTGRDNLRRYFQQGLEAFPELRFRLIEVLFGPRSVVFYYENQRGSRTAEYMEISPDGKVARVVANYND